MMGLQASPDEVSDQERIKVVGLAGHTMAQMSRDLAIDLGTANTLVYAKGRGIVLNEPTVVALDTRSREVLAIGSEAWQMIGRTPGYIVAVRPMRQGAITDFDITERMLQVLLRRVGVGRLNRPRVLISVPSAITAVERRAVKEAARRAGASSSYLIEQPMAAAIGAGLAIDEPVGSMVVDVGGGTAEMAVISLGGVVALRAIRCGGFDFDAAIQAYVRNVHGVAIGERTAEAVKLAIGSAHPYEGEQNAEIRGREVSTGMPKVLVLSPEEVREAVADEVSQIIEAATMCLGDAPPELAQDIIFEGIHLVGGGSLLRGMTQRLADASAVPVHLVDTPLECVALGAGQCLESFEKTKRLFADD
jgi:rod shape-determining protein MreB and related proteins